LEPIRAYTNVTDDDWVIADTEGHEMVEERTVDDVNVDVEAERDDTARIKGDVEVQTGGLNVDVERTEAEDDGDGGQPGPEDEPEGDEDGGES
jgi:hypothetical protein